ncbi:pre-toxin TG domain-containing protein, partial [Streptococcus ruminantium]|uniref:pre-toxin TG domain-containing protein n=1 Tax=Streptococcus ruminantium TaxID=1917441 RepID=UPI0012DDBD37
WEQAKAIGQSVYDWGASRTREAANIARNWTKSLEETITHVCTTAERWVEAGVNFLRNVDWKNILKTAAGVAGEFFYVNDLYRVVTGTDPVSGEEANRLEATAWLAVDIISAGSSKLGKVATVATKADDLFDIVRSSKFVTQANKTLDGAKTFVKSNVDKLLDTSFQLGPKLAPAGGSSVGGTTLREVGQNVKKSLDNLVNYFKKNGDEVGKRTEKGTKGTKAVGNMSEFLDSDFGQELRDSLQKTSKRYDGQRVYKVIENIGNLKKGDQIYLDGLHKDHLEVFNKSGKVKSVLNLDGSINFEKTRKVLEQGRRLP